MSPDGVESTAAAGPRTPSRLRYLLLATHVPGSGSLGGVVRYTVDLAEALARRPDIDLHVMVAGDGGRAFAGIVAPERIIHLPALPTAVLSLLERWSVPPALRRGFDVVHGPKNLVPRWTSARRVLTVHDMQLFDRGRDYPPAKRLLLKRPHLASVRDAEVVVAVSHATRDRLLDHVTGVADRVHVTPLTVSPALMRADPEAVEALADVPFALVVGDASRRKNLALAVEIWPRVRERVPGAVLVTVGPPSWGLEDRGGALWAALVADGAAMSLRGISDGALRWCYEHARAVLCPSLLEGFGLPAAEASAFGAPLVTTEDPAMGEAAAGTNLAAASWSAEHWTDTVVTAFGRRHAPPAAVRTWDDVAADTIDAARGSGGAPGVGRGPRMGLSPFTAPLRVRHVVASGEAAERAERMAADHRAQGWKVEVVAVEPAASATDTDVDVLVLHGAAGDLRSRVQGRVPTVVLAPARPRNLVREIRMGRWTNVLALPPGASASWSRVAAPVVRLDRAEPDAEDAAAVITRALAWGSPRPRQTLPTGQTPAHRQT